MSAHHVPEWVPKRENVYGARDNGIFATWLSLISFTFFMGTFVAANVYLRGWSPDKFALDWSKNGNLPGITTLILLIAAILTLIAGTQFKKDNMKAFMGTMVVSLLAFVAYGAMQMWLMVFTYYKGANAWTAYLGVYVFQFILAVACVIFIARVGLFFSERNEKALRRLVPATLAVCVYTVAVGIMVLIITDMITVGQFTTWCGTKFTQLVNQ